MKKFRAILLLSFLLIPSSPLSAAQKSGVFEGSGEVVTVDPAYSRITIKHGAIKDFSADGQTEFFVESQDLLKGISTLDLVDFTIRDEKGDARIEKIIKTGVAVHEEGGLRVGEAVNDVIRATGETARFVTSPIPPASDAVGGAFEATAGSTGNAVKDARGPKVKQNF